MKNLKRFFLMLTEICFVLTTFIMPVHYIKAETYPESKGECVMELNSRRVLYENHADTRLPMASTTKIVTCITVLNCCNDINQEIVIPQEAVGIEGSSVYLKAGDVYSIKDLLYGLMLRSGNDCAVALALHCQQSIKAFAKKMNEFAQSAGALCSHFVNPHGLPHPNHYTTAYDLALITCAAMQNPVFLEIVSTKYYAPKNWYNKNKMLTEYEGGTGVKTGFTKLAGRCLVSSAKRENMHIVGVVLNSPMMFERTQELLDSAFQVYRLEKLIDVNEILSNGKIQGKSKTVFYYPLSDGEKVHIERKMIGTTIKNNKEIVGQFQIYLTKRLLFSGNLYKL